jgi:hypothetical protein
MRSLYPATCALLLLLMACSGEAPPDTTASQNPQAPPASTPVPTPEQAEPRVERGPHAGRLLRSGDFALELRIFEDGVPPEFHTYGYWRDEPLPPERFESEVTLTRLGGVVERFEFVPVADFRRGRGVVGEPHSFDVEVKARHEGAEHSWTFQSHEGRAEIPATVAEKAGLKTATAGPATLQEQLSLAGVVRGGSSGTHIEVEAYGRDAERLAVSQSVEIEAVIGNARGSGKVRSLARESAAQRGVRAHIALDDASAWERGQFVRTRIVSSSHRVPLAVRTAGLQRFRNADVVFARVGDVYEVRMIDLGRGDAEWTEVLDGLRPGEEYVTDNSFLVSAEVQKHDGGHSH